MGVQGGGPACWAATRLGGRETKLVYLKLGAILNTVQGSLYPTHHAHIQTHTHTHTQGCAMGPPMWPWRCGLMARPVSGVECGSGVLIFNVKFLHFVCKRPEMTRWVRQDCYHISHQIVTAAVTTTTAIIVRINVCFNSLSFSGVN